MAHSRTRRSDLGHFVRTALRVGTEVGTEIWPHCARRCSAAGWSSALPTTGWTVDSTMAVGPSEPYPPSLRPFLPR